MKDTSRHHSVFTLTLLAAASSGALAQEPAKQPALEEITVTATRRAENLQDTGATVSALSADAMADRSVQSVADIAQLNSGIDIATYQGDTSIFIRGIGTPTIIAGSDSSTATYADGVFISRAASIGPAFFDVERVEVLRGPQGTLYGRNATGGAVNIISKSPGEEWGGEARLTLGDYQRVKAFAAAGGPLTNSVRARIAVQKESREGYTTVTRADNSQDDVEDKDDITVKAQLHWDITDSVSAKLIGEYYRADDQAAVYHLASTGYAEEVDGWYSTREGAATGAYFAYRQGGRVHNRASRELYSDVEYKNNVDIKGVTARIDWATEAVDVVLTGAYKSSNPNMQNEFDNSDAFVNRYRREEQHWQRSVDIQFSSNNEGPLRWVAGGGWFEESNTISNDIFGNFWEPILRQGFADLQAVGVLPAFPINIPESDLCCTLQLNGQQQTKAWAVYLDGSYDINEKLTAHFGMRHSNEERDGRQQFQLLFGDGVFAPNALFFPGAITDSRNAQPDPLGFVVAPVHGPAEFEAFTPKLGLDYRLNEDKLVYFQIQKGFKTGGYNIGSSQLDPYKPEKIWSYELGLKSEWLDNSLRVNSALFHYRYENLQAQDSIGNQPIIRNVGKSEVSGFETEFKLRVNESWLLDGGFTFLNAEFTEGQLTEPLRPAPAEQAPGSLVRDLDGLSLTRAPRWKLNVGLQYSTALENLGQLSARLDYSWQDKVYYTVFNIDAASQVSYGVVNARIMFDSEDEQWGLALFGKNLADETYFTNQILTGTVYGAEFVGTLAPPRTWGVEASYRF